MYASGETIILSATDLVGYLECEHLLQLERRAALGELERPTRDDPELDLVSVLGEEHEHKHLERFRAEGRSISEIPDYGNSPEALKRAEADTLEAMRRGVDVIYQATFFDGRWLGKADFLLKTPTPTDVGNHGYEVADAKLARHAKTRALLQIALYSDHLGRLQGRPPEQMHLILGDDTTASFPVVDYVSYARVALARLEDAMVNSPQPTYPNKVEHCSRCRWLEVCDANRRKDDHLSIVAGIRRDQIKRLNLAEIKTVKHLADSPADLCVDGIGENPLRRLQVQARLQVVARENGGRLHELTDEQRPGIGLAALPEPNLGDLFFDMEGDPHYADGGLEYLFGIVELDAAGRPVFRSWWAHDRDQEKAAFEQFVDFVIQRWERNPGLHIYHYASYEPDALKRLMGRHATREQQVDEMLRKQLFVDLYRALRQGVRISEESYSLKSVERFYMPERGEAVKDAGSSIVQYERYRREQDQVILRELEEYNRVDCESTAQLRDWLEELRREASDGGPPLPRPQPRIHDPSEELRRAEAEVAELTAWLLEGVPEDAGGRTAEEQARWLLAQSLSWHRREAKADWWAYYSRLDKTDAELVEDRDSIGELKFVGELGRVKNSLVRRYSFDPEQEHKISEGDRPVDPRTQESPGTVCALDPERGYIDLKRRIGDDAPHPTSLIPARPYTTTEQRLAIKRLAERILEGGLGASGIEAASDLLLRRPPRAAAGTMNVLAMERTTLPVQGPPGTGKTYLGARMILDLVQRDRQVAVTATSHKVISNLLLAVLDAAKERGRSVRVMQRCDETDHCGHPLVECAENNEQVLKALRELKVDVVGGTAWLWSREEMTKTVSHVFIDEAGQMSLANVLAVSGAADNLVLLGDPQQLAQPSKGSHPEGADVSALGHVLGDAATLSDEQGLFLATTWRMHPDVCRFISLSSYDGRLQSEQGCEVQRVDAPGIATGTGLRYYAAEHWGNRTSSPEEAEIVRRLVADLTRGTFTDREGRVRRLRLADILVVAPFNAQVARVRGLLGEGGRVGTVDKFQGQQAPVVIYTVATSSPDDLPRNMEFLYSLNRLNVAVSRAQALAIVVCSPELLQVRGRSPEQLRLANALCLMVEMAQRISFDSGS
jgi:uncharacterized protein